MSAEHSQLYENALKVLAAQPEILEFAARFQIKKFERLISAVQTAWARGERKGLYQREKKGIWHLDELKPIVTPTIISALKALETVCTFQEKCLAQVMCDERYKALVEEKRKEENRIRVENAVFIPGRGVELDLLFTFQANDRYADVSMLVFDQEKSSGNNLIRSIHPTLRNENDHKRVHPLSCAITRAVSQKIDVVVIVRQRPSGDIKQINLRGIEVRKATTNNMSPRVGGTVQQLSSYS